ncbi:MAG: hypothetical protein OXU66_10185, partial [Gammaproteobacteria bacterium]|nr:hypothetical protein [Gammaproteobacteria bacterium]MDD9959298.1 hypothetical protein [Gammaproteobacteria bacterium]
MDRSPSQFLILTFKVLFLFTGLAQSPNILSQEFSDDGTTVIYPANYFEQWSPITAQDMLDRIPGQSN